MVGRGFRDSEHVLCIASPDYLDCWHGRKVPGVKNGATHEAQTLQNRLYEGGANTEFLRFALFADGDKAFVPLRVKGLTYYRAHDHAAILAWLNGCRWRRLPRAWWRYPRRRLPVRRCRLKRSAPWCPR